MTPPLRPSSEQSIVPLSSVEIGGRTFARGEAPSLLRWDDALGIVTALPLRCQRLHSDTFTCHPRAQQLPDGTFILLTAAGPRHYAWCRKEMKGNRPLLFRSRDGWNWEAPVVPWDIPYNQHAPVPFLPKRSGPSGTLYAFGTEPRFDRYDGEENAAIGFRSSQDGGATWSEAQFIEPRNDPGFQGMSAMRLCETEDGTWLLGSHSGYWFGEEGVDRRVVTRQYILRSTDAGKTWDIQPAAPSDEWYAENCKRIDEGRPIHLGDNRVLMLIRTPTGRLWQLRSANAGRTWTVPKPTTLAHPDAPPMIFHLDPNDERTLVVFHHNRAVSGAFAHLSRTELWVSLSRDGGLSWGEPRFVLANACEAATLDGWGGSTPMASYADLLVHDGWLDLFIDHQMRQIFQARMKASDLAILPTRADLQAAAA